MDSEKVERLSALSALQIACLAVAGSTIAAIAVLMGLRKIGLVTSRSADSPAPPPQVQPRSTGPHFSEDTVIPGFTHTGAEILAEDEQRGFSAGGV